MINAAGCSGTLPRHYKSIFQLFIICNNSNKFDHIFKQKSEY